VQVNDVAVLVAKDLHFEVFGVGDVLFQETASLPKALFLGLRFIEQMREISLFLHDPHASPAAAESGFEIRGKPISFPIFAASSRSLTAISVSGRVGT